MRAKRSVAAVSAAFLLLWADAASCGTAAPVSENAAIRGVIAPQDLAQVVPGQSTKADIQSLLGAPWRVVQFNDCGQAMDDQADETWEYRGKDSNGAYRIHVEFDDHEVVHLLAKIPDGISGGKGIAAKIAPASASKAMSM
jgi:hypothetical protein